MFADALREVRYHRGRVVATLIAIAITVGFMVAISSLLATAQHAIGSQLAITASKADVVVKVDSTQANATTIGAAIKKVPGVGVSQFMEEASSDLTTSQGSANVQLLALPEPVFRWAGLKTGNWPTASGQITVTTGLAKKFGLSVGSFVSVSSGTKLAATVVGISNEPSGTFQERAYVIPGDLRKVMPDSIMPTAYGVWAVQLAPEANSASVVTDLNQALKQYSETISSPSGAEPGITVQTGRDYLQQSIEQTTRDFNALRYVLYAFTAIAAVVGIIIIANTFTILLTQRRRQIGLLRAVGATGSQVRRKLLAEALILGAVGSLAGVLLGLLVTWVGAIVGNLIFYGLHVPWGTVAVEFAIGVVLTILAAVVPSTRATRVAPMEALRPVQTSDAVKRASRVRLVVCSVLAVVGIALAVMSQRGAHNNVVLAVVAALLISFAVLFGAPLYVPQVLRGLAAVISPAGASARLAGSNVRRNPARAAATATALMLAVGLIVTLQVGTATLRNSMLTAISERFPIDLVASVNPYASSTTTSASPTDPQASWLPAAVPTALQKVSAVKQSAVLSGATVQTTDEFPMTAMIWNDSVLALPHTPAKPNAGQVIVSYDSALARAKQLSLKTLAGGTKAFGISSSPALTDGQIIIAPDDAATLISKAQPVAVWMNLANHDDISAGVAAVNAAIEPYSSQLQIDGSAPAASIITKVLNILLMVVTGLLGVAVLIALIGVGNTLGLSVIERRRESALLRAMGMQKRELRVMLLWEALLLALAGVLVGVVAGIFFGWLGISSVLKQIGSNFVQMHFAINGWQTAGMVAIALGAAALASVLPGRRAASAPPVSALAEE